MSLLSVRDITKTFGGRRILDGATLEVPEAARIGLIGGNGSGKSTLLRIAAGLEEADAGSVTRRRGLRLALLPQHPLGDRRTPLETAREARTDLAAIDIGLAECERELAQPSVHADPDRMQAVLELQAELIRLRDEVVPRILAEQLVLSGAGQRHVAGHAPRALPLEVAGVRVAVRADRRQGGRLLGEVCHFIDTCVAITGSEVAHVLLVGRKIYIDLRVRN